MPAAKIDEVLATKPVTFNLKTSGGSWKCQIHPNRAAYEKTKSAVPSATPAAPGIARTDSGFSTTSSSSAASTTSSSH